ncbi:TonB family protein [Pedobacter sp. SYSU D00535]|uniref:TonB family protein n=1 Tax=Pedobacter sp. SYSU D00535 TaxID=2810308 RepID=UPI001A95EBDC|nr:TonB family protein [Pedobacter sp. SYSU D00535]
MKVLTLFFSYLSFLPFYSQAQEDVPLEVIKRDTIHLKGVVVDMNGAPVPFISLRSESADLRYGQCYLGALTDSLGRFEIRGAHHHDTISLAPYGNYTIQYQNKGSRFITIQIPTAASQDVAAGIEAKRIQTKLVPAFTIYRPAEFVNCGCPPVTVNAGYPGGEEAFKKFIEANLRYPNKAIEKNIEGTVKIGFRIAKNGSLSNFVVLDGIGYGCDEEALRVMKLSKNWYPFVRSSRPVVAEQTVAIRFELED